jgi:hypothetical protein
VKLRQGTGNGQRELGPGAEASVGGNNAMQSKSGAKRPTVERRAAPCKLERAIRIGTLGAEIRGKLCFEEQRRSRRGRADAAEPPTEVASQIEHPEVEARGRFDEDNVTHGVAGLGAVST